MNRTGILLIVFFAFILIFLFKLADLYYNGFFGTHYRLTKTQFANLPGWEEDDHVAALAAFQQSCQKILKQHTPPSSALVQEKFGQIYSWQHICIAANQLHNVDKSTARKFFESHFEPYHLTNNYNANFLFTGYYLPLLKACLTADKGYCVPVYGLPSNLIKIKISLFGKGYKHKKSLVGVLKEKTVYPYFSREEINSGVIKNVAKILVWVDSPVDFVFAQIQGSAILQLPDHKQMLLSYAGDNGHPYKPLGTILIEKKILERGRVSMQSIRDWFLKNPSRTNEIINEDPSFVFFQLLKKDKPVGTEGVPLTPERSLAVDTYLIPLGAPIWLKTQLPTPGTKSQPFSRLVIAQDTGGAIKGMHGDIYWGPGERAEYIAGHLQNKGQCWILLPQGNR